MLYSVNEVFESIQGEAAFTGTPSVFIRLQGCHVGCEFCDVKTAWPLPTDSDVNALPLTEILEKRQDAPTFAFVSEQRLVETILRKFKARHVVITGGEPCLHDLMPLTEELLANGRSVQIETSGACNIKVSDGVWVTVSPKLGMPGSAGPLTASLTRADEIKMPIGKQRDIDNLKDLLTGSKSALVWLQPLSLNEKATQFCIDAATEFGWKVSLQTHKFIGVR